ncbi:DUF397 domain-containing protein [Streptomyces decoyicus]|uniref:DUF397 domain-containing protein n=1 Tax=Streptomyces decoyicus TaxID=249567 RepID=UPI003864C889
MTQHTKSLASPDVIAEEEWKKSSYSSQENGNCVETATSPDAIRVRDSKTKKDILTFTPDAWTSFVGLVPSGDVDFDVIDN